MREFQKGEKEAESFLEKEKRKLKEKELLLTS